jgi:hypothetical protein
MEACGGTRRTGDEVEGHAHTCVQTGERTVAFEEVIVDKPPRDAWYVVIATGLDGRPLGPVYASLSLARFGTFEVAQRLYDLITALTTLRTPRLPSVFPTVRSRRRRLGAAGAHADVVLVGARQGLRRLTTRERARSAKRLTAGAGRTRRPPGASTSRATPSRGCRA